MPPQNTVDSTRRNGKSLHNNPVTPVRGAGLELRVENGFGFNVQSATFKDLVQDV